jgi:hypothetical protein
MKVKNLLDMVKVLQAGLGEFYGLEVGVAESEYVNSPVEKELGINLFGVALQVLSPTKQVTMTMMVGWEFHTGEGVHLSRGHRVYGGSHVGLGLSQEDEYDPDPMSGRRKLKPLTLETDLQSVKVFFDSGSDDLLCHLRPFVKKNLPKVEVLLERRR